MSTGIDLGEIGDLAKAIGLTDESSTIRSDWLSNPGNYLSSVLADDTQRNALIDFVDQILAIDREADADGLIWLQIAENQDPHVIAYVVIDPTPSDYVAIGAGVRVTSSNPDSDSSTYVPIFRAAKTGHSVPDPILIGQSPDAVIRISTEVNSKKFKQYVSLLASTGRAKAKIPQLGRSSCLSFGRLTCATRRWSEDFSCLHPTK
jgi:large repetitive protein